MRALECQVSRDCRPEALQDFTDWELATVVAEHTGRTPADVLVLSGAELLALVGLRTSDVYGEEAP
jgi:hypothetical protein